MEISALGKASLIIANYGDDYADWLMLLTHTDLMDVVKKEGQ